MSKCAVTIALIVGVLTNIGDPRLNLRNLISIVVSLILLYASKQKKMEAAYRLSAPRIYCTYYAVAEVILLDILGKEEQCLYE